jgi:hypothetical protein
MNHRQRIIWQWAALLAVAVLLAVAAAGCGGPRVSRLTILVSGNTLAYYKNCGCSSGQKGGEVRKARLLREEREVALRPKPADKSRKPEVLALDIGNYTNPSDGVNRIYSLGIVESTALLGYQSVGLGLHELRYTQDELYNLMKDRQLPLNAANLTFTKPDEGTDRSQELTQLLKQYVVVKLKDSGLRVGIVHVLDRWVGGEVEPGWGYKVSPASEAAQKIISEHKREADFWILTIADAVKDGAEIPELAALKDYSCVIGALDRNPLQAQDSTAAIMPYFIPAPYQKAKDLVRAVVYFNPGQPTPSFVVQRMNISDTIRPDDQAAAILATLQRDLEKFQNDIDKERPQQEMHPRYMGHESCRDCHEGILNQMKEAKHSIAYVSLRDTDRQPDAHRSAACLPCHVVGHYLKGGNQHSGGWNIYDNQPMMQGVQCESCHGPGEYHVKVEREKEDGGEKNVQYPADYSSDGRDKFGLIPATKDTCVGCHDEANSPKFNFDEYWAKIDHKSKDEAAQ